MDLIVIATHGYTGWKHFRSGALRERVVRAAQCPVLVVRKKEHEFVNRSPHPRNQKTSMNATLKSNRWPHGWLSKRLLVGMNHNQLTLLTDCAMVG